MLMGKVTPLLASKGELIGSTDLLLCFHEKTVLLATRDEAVEALPHLSALNAFLPKDAVPQPLFASETLGCIYMLDTAKALDIPPNAGFAYVPVGIFRDLPSQEEGFCLISSWHLVTWFRRNRFCGACATPLKHSETERALCCPNCGQIIYPSISPAISVAITDGDRLLMAKGVNASFTHFSLIAGYVEVGESIEETVAREAMEEVGLKVKNIRYIASQPWGLSQAEMLGFHAELDGDDKITLQKSELAEAHWFHRDEIPLRHQPLSLSFELIERFRAGVL